MSDEKKYGPLKDEIENIEYDDIEAAAAIAKIDPRILPVLEPRTPVRQTDAVLVSRGLSVFQTSQQILIRQNNNIGNTIIDIANVQLDTLSKDIANQTLGLVNRTNNAPVVLRPSELLARQALALILSQKVCVSLTNIMNERQCDITRISASTSKFAKELAECLIRGERDLWFRPFKRGVIKEKKFGGAFTATFFSFFGNAYVYEPYVPNVAMERFDNVVETALQTVARKRIVTRANNTNALPVMMHS